MTDTEFDPLDLNEDGEVSPMEKLIGLAGELETLQAEDFNLWRADGLARMKALIAEGVEGEGFVYRDEPEPTPDTEFGPDGFSASGIFVQHQAMIEMANRWAESKDRTLEYGARWIQTNRYMLPLDRLQADEEFQQRYAKNLDTAKNTFTIGRSGYKNQPVFESFVANDYRGRTFYVGSGVIPDTHFPYAGAHQPDIIEIYVNDIESGAARERILQMAHNALAEMDRGNLDKWEGYRPVPNALQWNRRAELELARSNPNY